MFPRAGKARQAEHNDAERKPQRYYGGMLTVAPKRRTPCPPALPPPSHVLEAVGAAKNKDWKAQQAIQCKGSSRQAGSSSKATLPLRGSVGGMARSKVKKGKRSKKDEKDKKRKKAMRKDQEKGNAERRSPFPRGRLFNQGSMRQ